MKKRLDEKAKHLGVSVSTYIKHLILNDMDMPVYEASDRVNKAYEESLRSKDGISTNGRKASEVLDEIDKYGKYSL